MDKCSICGSEKNNIEFRAGFVCEGCLEYIKKADIGTEPARTSCRKSSRGHSKRSNQVVMGSEKKETN